MTATDSSAAQALAPAATTVGQRSRLRAVAMPTEHGGWSLTVEPVLLGLLVAWSWGGLALGVAAMFAFMARTPLKLVLVDRFRHRWLDRSGLAARVAAVEAVAILALVVVATTTTTRWFWVPLVAASPLVLVELWFDMRSRGRRLLPEVAGTVGIGSVAAAIALLGGSSEGLALGLWCVVAARGAAAIPYVRTQLCRRRGKAHRVWHSDLAQVLAVGAVAVAATATALPWASAVAVAAIAAVNITAVRLTPRPPVAIGIQQMVFGLAVIAATAVAV